MKTAFALGAMLARPRPGDAAAEETPAEVRVTSIVTASFMFLAGVSMSPLAAEANYFWRHRPNEYLPFSDDRLAPSPWLDFAQDLHEQAVQLDRGFLASTFQGGNSRIAAVFEEVEPRGGVGKASCLHYRRFGTSAFVIAVDGAGGTF